jgi:hypothetical protein
MLTTKPKFIQASNFVAANYQKNSDNFFLAAKKPQKQYKTMTQLLKECPLIGASSHGLNYIA